MTSEKFQIKTQQNSKIWGGAKVGLQFILTLF